VKTVYNNSSRLVFTKLKGESCSPAEKLVYGGKFSETPILSVTLDIKKPAFSGWLVFGHPWTYLALFVLTKDNNNHVLVQEFG
jgi:hypothetical protein